MIFVRSKCDNFGGSQLRTVDEEIAEDRALLKSWGIANPKILATTANAKSYNFDNESVKTLLMN